MHALRLDLGMAPVAGQAPPRNFVFFGPPGTGKTLLAVAVAKALTNEAPSQKGSVRIIQFHPSYGYEDFVGGIRPVLRSVEVDGKAASNGKLESQLGFEWVPGPFMVICQEATRQPHRLFVIIIDEINRGDPARIFGELLYALEYRGQAVQLASGNELIVPSNLIVIGTMNSVDRSVALVDYALRRRFTFVRFDPDPKLIRVKHNGLAGLAATQALSAMNDYIVKEVDRDHQIGHSYFLSPGCELATREDITRIWQDYIEPQLSELFHGQVERVTDLQTIWQDQLSQTFTGDQEAEAEADES